MTDNAARFLGFAFASADLLLEIDPDGKVVFLMGATQKVLGMEQSTAMGKAWREMIAAPDHDLVDALISGLGPADRRGPIRVELPSVGERKVRRFGAFSACRLPQVAPNVSCVLALAQASLDAESAPPAGEHGLHDHAGFMAATQKLLDGARAAGLDLNLELVELKGLQGAADGFDDEQTEAVFRRISAAVRSESYRGEGAAKLGSEQYALIRNRADTPDHLLGRLEKAAAAAGATIDAKSATLALTPEEAPLHTMRALRFALDSFIKDGSASAKTAFQTVLENTVVQATAFSTAVKDRTFQLVFQPVVELESLELDHFETLVRLEPNKSPAKTIRMAEELELIVGLDLAIAEQVIAKLSAKGNGKLRLSANVSAKSLVRPEFMTQLLKLIAAEPGIANRLIFEVTESATFDDLDLANTSIQRIRQHGAAVHLDDFGAGAASMAYLKSFSVDGVKIDGQYVKEVAESGRDSTLVRHVAQLCDELGILAIAEMVETGQAVDALIGIGVKYGQGWRFGRPTPEPTYQRPPAVRARRVGEVEGWG